MFRPTAIFIVECIQSIATLFMYGYLKSSLFPVLVRYFVIKTKSKTTIDFLVLRNILKTMLIVEQRTQEKTNVLKLMC